MKNFRNFESNIKKAFEILIKRRGKRNLEIERESEF